jgi:hypothetical protein
MQQTQGEQPKTISPKDAVLHDFDQNKDHSLSYLQQYDFNLGDTPGLQQDNTFQPAPPSFPLMESFPNNLARPQYHPPLSHLSSVSLRSSRVGDRHGSKTAFCIKLQIFPLCCLDLSLP